jgi:hypothetical protein
VHLSPPSEQRSDIAGRPDGLRSVCAARRNGPVVVAKIRDAIEAERLARLDAHACGSAYFSGAQGGESVGTFGQGQFL